MDFQVRLSRYCKKFKSLSPEKVVREIGRGLDNPTQAAINLSGTATADIAYRKRLVDAGLIPTLLQFLSHCENEKFLDLLAKTDGDLALPSLWVNLLLNTIARDNLPSRAQMDEIRVEISKGMGPLIRCMTCSNGKREFFCSNMFWHNFILMGIALLQNLCLTPATIPILLEFQDRAVIDLLVQSMFWETKRPDIINESKSYAKFVLPNSFAGIRSSAVEALKEMADVEKNTKSLPNGRVSITISNQGKDRLARMMTKIVSPDYDPNCKTSLCVGLIDLMKKGVHEQREQECRLYILQQFAVASLVENPMIIGTIEFVTKNVNNDLFSFDAAEGTVGLVCTMLNNPDVEQQFGASPDDDRFAVAIKAGLFEMLLKLLVRFGNSDRCTDMMDMIKDILHCASAVALLKKTSRAINGRRSEIMEAVNNVARTCPTEKTQEVIAVVRSIINVNSSGEQIEDSTGGVVAFCRRCHKNLQKDEIKRCSKCQRAIYCSRNCQVDDWKNGGHKRDCKHMASSGLQAMQSGGGKKNVKRAETHEANVSMAGNKLFGENVGSIITQASIQGYDLLDCMTLIDLCHAPPSIEVKLASDFLSDDMSESDENFAHTKRIIERNRANGALTVACISLGTYEQERGPRAILLKTFPGLAAPGGSWASAQGSFRLSMGDHLLELMNDPDAVEAQLKDLRRAR